MSKKKPNSGGYRIGFAIYDNNGKTIFEWKPGMNNVVEGITKAREIVTQKLGIDEELLDNFYKEKRKFEEKRNKNRR